MAENQNQIGRIHVLDVLTSNQIAAGEVVERPVSAVKELVENAIDAGAKRVTIKLKQNQQHTELSEIEVIDDGCGMVEADMKAAFYRHATSKIKSADDLEDIHTLGFRGEALPSIAAVSKVLLSSRMADNLSGHQVEVIDGKPKYLGEVGMPLGTRVLVKDLFYNTPARKKFLKSAAVELGHITTLISRLILSRPDIAFVLSTDGRTILHSSGNGDQRQAVIAVYGGEVASQLALVSYEDKITVQGFVSIPPFSRSSKKYYHFFVNGRLVKSKELATIVEVAYDTLMPEKKYPMVVLYLEVPANTIDVNVHPAKTEIRFHQLDLVRQCLLEAVKTALSPEKEVPAATQKDIFDIGDSLEGFVMRENKRNPLHQQSPTLVGNFTTKTGAPQQIVETTKEPKDNASAALLQNLLAKQVQPAVVKTEEGQEDNSANFAARLFAGLTGVMPGGNKAPKPQPATPAAQPEQQQIFSKTENIFQLLKPLGQVNASYIVAVAGEDLYIVDQHAAHERVLYEEFSKRFATEPGNASMLAVPVTIELGNLQKELLLQNIEQVLEFGFIVEHFGDSTFVIRGVPAWYQEGQEDARVNKAQIFKESIGEFFITILDKITDNRLEAGQRHDLNFAALKKEELFTMACKNAVKANQLLNQSDIMWLFQKLSQAEKPQTCPHGRPTIIKISDGEIRRRFMRG